MEITVHYEPDERHIKIKIPYTFSLMNFNIQTTLFNSLQVFFMVESYFLSSSWLMNWKKTTPSSLPYYYVDLYKRGLPFPYVQLDIRVP